MRKGELRFAENETASVKERKKKLRAYMKARRTEEVNRDAKEELLAENFFALLESEGAGTCRSVLVYLSYSHEARTDKLVERLLEKGITVYCPRVEGKEMVVAEYGEALALSERGIREPIGEAFVGDIDVAAVPLLAADEEGNRLGYGGGYYDKYLSAHPKTFRVGYCYDTQLVREVPTEENDAKLDAVVTDKRFLKIRKQREK